MTDRVLNNLLQKYSKTPYEGKDHETYSFVDGEGYKQNDEPKDNIPNTQRVNPKRDNSSQLTGIQGDSLTSDLHDKMYLINEFRTAFNESTKDDRRKWDKMFKVIPLSDEILKLPDDQRISSIYNDLLKYFFQIYGTLDTFERREFFNQFPELRDMLSSKIKENIEVNKKFAKISTKGFKTAEDLKYLYDISHKLTDKTLSEKGYFSNKEKGLNTEIIQSLMSLKHANYTSDENYATGHGELSEDISSMKNHFSSGIIKRMWRDKFTEAGKAVKSAKGPRITSEPYQHFLFTLNDIKKRRDEDVNKDGLYRSEPPKTATIKDINEPKPKPKPNTSNLSINQYEEYPGIIVEPMIRYFSDNLRSKKNITENDIFSILMKKDADKNIVAKDIRVTLISYLDILHEPHDKNANISDLLRVYNARRVKEATEMNKSN